MKNTRTFIALLLLCGLLLVTAVSGVTVHRVCGRLLDAAEQVADVLREHPDDAPAAIEALERQWQRDSAKLRLFVPNETLVDLNETVARLDAMREAECDELTAELTAIRADLLWIRAREHTVF